MCFSQCFYYTRNVDNLPLILNDAKSIGITLLNAVI